MPAQWPIFINNVSSKLASRSPKGPDDWGTFVANEYFNAVKTSQTPFGNLHQSGQKSILEQGFKKAFNDLFKSETPTLIDKLTDPKFADLLEELPVIPKFNITKELRKCIIAKGTDTPFYEFFPPLPDAPDLTNANTFGSVDDVNQPTITFTGENGVSPYTFTYTINDGEPINIISDEIGIAAVYVPFDVPGKFKYTLTGVVDTSSPEIQHDLNQTVDIVIPKKLTKEVEVVNGPATPKLDLTAAEQLELVAKRLYYQNDGTQEYDRFIQRLNNSNVDGSFGTNVKNKINSWIKNKTKFTSPLSKKVFQYEYEDDKDVYPAWLTKTFICKFVYYPGIDNINSTEHGRSDSGKENTRTSRKVSKWKEARDAFNELKKKCIQDLADAAKKNEDDTTENDPYDTMAKAIIDYWKSTTVQPFKNSPPIPPCNVPSPGKYTPIYYGSQKSLAKNLRRAWNTGKTAQFEPLTQPITKAVATAVAVTCAKHLLELKFIYIGQLTVGTVTIPMIGFVPLAF